MKKKRYNIYSILIIVLSITINMYGQVGIGTSTPEGMLDIENNAFGFVYPRVTLTDYTTEAPVINPNDDGSGLAIGTSVYNTALTTNGANDVSPGIYSWDGSRWVAQFHRRDYQKFEQTGAPFRTTIRESYGVPDTSDVDDVPGLTNQTFTPKYSGTYKIEVQANLAAGELAQFQTDDAISLSSMEGSFFFTMSGTGVDIDPTSAIYSNDDGWFYVHPFAIYNATRATHEISDIIHYSSGVYYLYLIAGHDYDFNLSNCIITGDAFFVNNGDTGAGQGYVGKEIPCTVEFTFIND